jgi:probable H4MPT-linked C1 transfer pathway protein
MKIAGFDIGGANTDLAVIDFDNLGNIKKIETAFEFLPMWSNKEDLGHVLIDLIKKISDLSSIDGIGVSMTAELVDAYETKKEGVLDISKRVRESFDLSIGFLGLNGILSFTDIEKDPLNLAAANWIATAHVISEIAENCIFIDAGSTTTDIIPIKNGHELAKGRSDFERLSTGELVYTGTLRTNIATFVDKIPLHGNEYSLSSELFATTADIYNILGEINIEDYTCSTSDGGGKSKKDSMRRIARVLCGDLDTLSEKDIMAISNHCYNKQVEQIAIGLEKVANRENIDLVITTGLGGDFLAKKSAESLNMEVKSMNEFFTKEECVVAPAIGTAVLMEKYLNPSHIS